MGGTVLWDFDGTLAQRPGLWSQALVEVLDQHDPGHGLGRDDLRPALRDGFPWHRAEDPHPHLNDPEAWWREIGELLAGAYRSVGYDHDRAAELAGLARGCFLDPARWQVFDDTRPALERLRAHGWSHVIVSNHVPELAQLVEALDLADQVDGVVTSALVGYEKPRREIFEHALEVAGRPSRVWMVGDNPTADVAGAERLGIPAVLVRREGEVQRQAADLLDAAEILVRAEPG